MQVLSCKNVFSGYQKVPRSPTTPGGRTPKSVSEMKKRPYAAAHEEGLPVRLLADSNSLFITCQGLALHYKLSFPGSSPLSLSPTSFLEPNSRSGSIPMSGDLESLSRNLLSVAPKKQRLHHRSYSIQFPGSSLHAPLLDGLEDSCVFSEDIPSFCLNGIHEEDKTNKLDWMSLEQDQNSVNPNGHFGIVLVHGFGGGVFSWRHVMGSLARQCKCPVAAFDRPGWGLTSRMRQEEWEEKKLPNPYMLESQVITSYDYYALYYIIIFFII